MNPDPTTHLAAHDDAGAHDAGASHQPAGDHDAGAHDAGANKAAGAGASHQAAGTHDAGTGHQAAQASHQAAGAHDAGADHQAAHTGAQHDRHAGHSVEMFRDKFWLSLALSIPVFIWSRDPQEWLGYTAPSFPGSDWIPPVLGTFVFLYGGLVFLRGARGELADRRPGMMTLISLAIVVAFVASWAGTLSVFEIEIWWELSSLISIMLLGHWLEMRSIAQARGALTALAELLPDTAERVAGGATETVSLDALAVDDVVLVRPGGRIPVDGVVVDGSSYVDESMITGESRPITKEPGATVVAGTVTAGGSLRVRVTAVGEGTALSGIMRMVAAAQASASRAQALADRAAAALFYAALVAAAITFAYWWLDGDEMGALTRMATVLVIACPHALGLAIPLVIAISTSLGARNGLLVKNRIVLERARELDVVIFDKTGTLTKGTPTLAAVSGHDEAEVLRLAASVEADSEHPLGRAIVAGAQKQGIEPMPSSGFEALTGRGARATVDGRAVAVGGPRLLADAGLEADPASEEWEREGRTVLHVVADGAVIGALAVEDEIRPESAEAIDRLHAMGLKIAMITGDAQAVADSVARRLGIDEVAAQVLPADKADAVKRFGSGGRKVAMVGDGVNDAPALATADVGIAIGAGTDVAVESAGIVLVRSDPRDVVGAIQLSRATYRKMIQNLVWATAYNLVAIPVAAGMLVPWGFDMPMAAGAVAMSASTIIVAANAQLLRRLRLGPEPARHPTTSPQPA
ncbi:MAG TPA: heavy metal translocating P-type ATPase [Candidatus Limnocylindrales bacterium]|nr:heavy metal translocating P-type ATPase [Candidatus Limnocylindrales bacterium]